MVNEWTRDDLPEPYRLSAIKREVVKDFFWHDVLDEVAAHMNANHPKSEADRWRRAHAIVEQERDKARASLHEAYKVAQSYKVDAYQATERAEAAERNRDEWKARAEAAEQYAQAVSDSNRDNADRASRAERERDEWKARAEAAEARTTPAVTVEQRNAVADYLWNAMVGSARSVVRDVVAQAFDAAGIETGVEAEPAEDPVEAKARELYEVSNPDTVGTWETIHEALKDGHRRIAEHVLGQGDRHVDQ